VAQQITFDGVSVKDIDLMTPREVADAFRVNTQAVAKWGRAGKLTRVPTPGGMCRYLRSEVMGLLNGGAQ
jgi:predicted site-specific integrase-resolvase